MAPPCLRRRHGGADLYVQVKAGARRAQVQGLDDAGRLRLFVRAPAQKGRANAALEAWLAEALGLAKASVRVAAGSKSTAKRVALEGSPVALTQALAAWLAEHGADFRDANEGAGHDDRAARAQD